MIARVLDSRTTRIVAVVVALAALATIVVELFLSPKQKTATLFFPEAVHLYAGSEVDVLGVRIGTVTSVHPDGTQVRVRISYDAHRKIPAGAAAVVDEPRWSPTASSSSRRPTPAARCWRTRRSSR